MLPTANMSIEVNTKVVKSNFSDVNVKVTPLDKVEIVNTTIENTTFSPSGGSLIDSKKAVLHKSIKGDMNFDVVVVPENIGESFSVENTTKIDCGLPQGAANSFYFELKNNKNNTRQKYYYYHLNKYDLKKDVTFGKYSTDATTILIEENQQGQLVSVFLMGATMLEDSSLLNKVVFYSQTPVNISFKITGETYDLNTSKLDNDQLKSITFYNFGKITDVRLNGEIIDSNSYGGYIYFGDAPVLSVENIESITTGSMIDVYPNPFEKGELVIKFKKGVYVNSTIRIVNVLGSELYSSNVLVKEISMNRADFHTGVFLILLEQGGKLLGKSKFIVI
jgi:hypothetical protein